jgi:hypothetical protein
MSPEICPGPSYSAANAEVTIGSVPFAVASKSYVPLNLSHLLCFQCKMLDVPFSCFVPFSCLFSVPAGSANGVPWSVMDYWNVYDAVGGLSETSVPSTSGRPTGISLDGTPVMERNNEDALRSNRSASSLVPPFASLSVCCPSSRPRLHTPSTDLASLRTARF